MTYEDLTPEQQAKVQQFESTEELLAFVENEGLEISDDELNGIAGGEGWGDRQRRCPICQSTGIDVYVDHFKCRKCNHEWKRS